MPEEVSKENDGIPFIGEADLADLKAERKNGMIGTALTTNQPKLIFKNQYFWIPPRWPWRVMRLLYPTAEMVGVCVWVPFPPPTYALVKPPALEMSFKAGSSTIMKKPQSLCQKLIILKKAANMYIAKLGKSPSTRKGTRSTSMLPILFTKFY